MSAVRIRSVGLFIAAWALLFAPGAASGGSDTDNGRPDSDHIAAAVLAPTFGSDAFTAGRVGGIDSEDADHDRLDVTGPLPAAARSLTGCVAAGGTTGTQTRPHSVACRSAGPRAPPSF